MILDDRKRILILCKTYPSPSTRYVETSCVAGMDAEGRLVRLYPVPFRLIEDEQQFRKWQWISARVRRSKGDVRAESHRISVDTIELLGDPLPTDGKWAERRRAIASLSVFDDFDALEAARRECGVTLGLLRPSALIELQISRADSPKWTQDEVDKLMQAQAQGSLFDRDAEQRSLRQLRKLPFDFHYRYQCGKGDEAKGYKHKLVDWEVGALYWNVHRRSNWEELFRQKFLDDFRARDVLFLMGTIHRFPGQWLIVSVLYFPMQPDDAGARQGSLFPG